jgi:hypothetical protein
MLTLTSRKLRDVTFDPAETRFHGRVEITFHDSTDDAPFTARISVAVSGAPRSRYAHIEAALLDEAERDLRLRLARLPSGVTNIFAPAPQATQQTAQKLTAQRSRRAA